MMFRRTATIAKLGNRCLSTESPKVTIARNAMMLQHINEAKDASALGALTLPAVDLAKLPAELSAYSGFFQADNVNAATEKFTPDPTAWQNMSTAEFVAEEAQREETWPFVVGFAVLYGAMILFANSLPDEAKAKSRYAQSLERLDKGLGYGPAHAAHHGDDAHAHAHH